MILSKDAAHVIPNPKKYRKGAKKSRGERLQKKSMATNEIDSEIEGGEGTYWGLECKTCDSCKTSPAIVFCRADSAFLCGTCDARVHSANKLASRHERVRLCEVCEQAPAAVTCKADAAALCVTCDADIHSANPLARRHERLPVVPFFDPVSATAVKTHAHAAGGSDPGAGMFLLKSNDDVDEVDLKSADYFFSDVDPYLDLDYAESVVPVQSTKTVIGGPPLHPPTVDFDFADRSNPSYSTYSVCSSEVGVVPDGIGDVSTGYASGGRSGNQMTTTTTTTTRSAMTVMDREARVMRYREKRKNRKFEKTVRYASRKAYAETRPRIKGRFARRTEVETEVEGMYSSAAVSGIMVDGGYGLVPSF